jgi:hypothetical protein
VIWCTPCHGLFHRKLNISNGQRLTAQHDANRRIEFFIAGSDGLSGTRARGHPLPQ